MDAQEVRGGRAGQEAESKRDLASVPNVHSPVIGISVISPHLRIMNVAVSATLREFTYVDDTRQ